MTRLEDSTVAVVGLGLMGGSLAGALRGRCQSVIGVARRPESIETALVRGLIDQGTTGLEEGVRGADAVILATPVRVILRQLSEIGPLLREGCLLMDLGSTKARIVAAMASLASHVQPLGAHPMCGKESAGIWAADPKLFCDQTFVLTPLPRTSEAAKALACDLIRAVGARPLVLDQEVHDRLVAVTSHLPYLLACSLVGTADRMAARNPSVWEVAASGFRDTSRLAAGDVTVMMDILVTNRTAILRALGDYEIQLRDLARLIERTDEEGLRTILDTVCELRKGLFV